MRFRSVRSPRLWPRPWNLRGTLWYVANIEIMVCCHILNLFSVSHILYSIQFDTSKADGQYKKTASNLKLRSLRPDFRFTSIEEGLEKTCAWFKENYATARK